MHEDSPGKRFRAALKAEKPLQLVGAINAYVALMAQQIGYKALFLAGSGVANASYGLPDTGITTLDNVLEDVRRITAAVDLPLVVDIDTGWGSCEMIARTMKSMIRAGAAAVVIEDQTFQKRCGHLSGKEVVPKEEMLDRLKALLDARTDPNCMVIARTDALAVEGFESVIERAVAYRDIGVDVLFPEALQTLDQFREVKKAVGITVMANITEFGKTPLFSLQELRDANVDIALYPVTVARAMYHSAEHVLKELRSKGTQKHLVDMMQTRQQLYKYLNYDEGERSIK